jgi:hypothetical protein
MVIQIQWQLPRIVRSVSVPNSTKGILTNHRIANDSCATLAVVARMIEIAIFPSIKLRRPDKKLNNQEAPGADDGAEH